MTPEEAQRLAKGPLGDVMSSFPLRFAKAVFFGDGPVYQHQAKMRSATASLLDLGHGPLAVTCHHVMEEYRAQVDNGQGRLFQIGNCRLDPLPQLILDDPSRDVAVIGLTAVQARNITGDGEIGSNFFEPISWPPEPVREGEYVAFGGFPGGWRSSDGVDTITFSSFSHGASRVTVVRDTYFVSQFEREYWVKSFRTPEAPDLRQFGGLSGGPAFVLRGLYFDFVGLMYECSEDSALLYFRHASVIGETGRRGVGLGLTTRSAHSHQDASSSLATALWSSTMTSSA
jgi:hypothetical protein